MSFPHPDLFPEQSRELIILELPRVFQERIQGFRDRNSTFDADYLDYELNVCEQAATIAACLGSVDAIAEWRKLKWPDQRAAVPVLRNDHSGNSFAMSVALARCFLSEPEVIPMLHGALCPLVGCANYGCWSTTQPERRAS